MMPPVMQSDAQPLCPTAEPMPQWDALPEDIPCPRCEYNLRMLPQPRCPECGLKFAWAEVIESAKLAAICPHFEYQWRQRPVRSFLWTVWQLVRPWRFWQGLPLSVPPRIVSLLVFLLTLVIALQILSAGVDFAAHAAGILQIPAQYRARRTTAFWARLVVRGWYAEETDGERVLRRAVVLPAFAGVSWLCFSLFWQTRRRFKLARPLRARLIILSLALCLLIWHLVHALQTLAQAACSLAAWWPRPLYLFTADLASLAGLCAFYVSLGYGLKRHARVERAWSMVGLIAALQITLILFIVVFSAVQFDNADNPVSRTLRHVLPYVTP
jgi:hypothetical protein